MARELTAIYERGVLRPLEPLSLPEHQRVRLTIADDQPQEQSPAEPVNERREEIRWFAEESEAYAGQWVAIEGLRLVAHGAKLADVREAARVSGAIDPLFARVPSDKAPFGGW